MGPLLLEFCVSCPLPLGCLPALIFVLVLTSCQMLPSFLFAKTILPTYLLLTKKSCFNSKFYFANTFSRSAKNQLLPVDGGTCLYSQYLGGKSRGIFELEAASLVYRDSVEKLLAV